MKPRIKYSRSAIRRTPPQAPSLPTPGEWFSGAHIALRAWAARISLAGNRIYISERYARGRHIEVRTFPAARFTPFPSGWLLQGFAFNRRRRITEIKVQESATGILFIAVFPPFLSAWHQVSHLSLDQRPSLPPAVVAKAFRKVLEEHLHSDAFPGSKHVQCAALSPLERALNAAIRNAHGEEA